MVNAARTASPDTAAAPAAPQGTHRARTLTIVVLVMTLVVACALGARSLLRADGVAVVSYELSSELVGGQAMHETAMLPPNRPDHAPLLLLFHGRTGHSDDWARQPMLDALVALGAKAPVVISVDGGDHSYYHDRADGQWGSVVTKVVIPDAVRRFGIDAKRVAVAGYSMGGFGALDLALQNPGRFCAAGGHEPAIWRTGGESAPGAFDSAADFTKNDLVGAAQGRPHPFGATKLWLDRADHDTFIPGAQAFVAGLRAGGTSITTRVWPGVHGLEYLWPHISEPLAFYADALAHC